MASGLADSTISVLDHGFVRLDDVMASDLSVVNAARVSFARRKEEMDDADEGLIRFLMREEHQTPFEHNAFRFHIRCPIFVAREWFRHRIGCLTGDTEVTFVENNGHGTKRLRKTIDDLWRMWTVGELNGQRVSEEESSRIHQLAAEGVSQRGIARQVGVGRRAVRRELSCGTAYRDARWRVRKMRLRVLNENSGEFGTGHIADIVDKGIQPVYRLTLEDGKQITLTENHRVLTVEGWRTMRDALGLVGEYDHAVMTRECSLKTNGVAAYRDPSWMAERRSEGLSVSEIASEAGCSYRTVRKWLRVHALQFERGEAARGRTPWNRGLRYTTGRRLTDEHKDAIRKARSGSRSNFWRGGVTPERMNIARWSREQAPVVHARFDYTCQSCGVRGGKLHAHHVVPVWLDARRGRDIDNLVTVCDACHRAIHRTRASELEFAGRIGHRVATRPLVEVPRGGWRLTAHPVRVVSVEYVGLRQTYDLCVDGPWHNFVANGIVVHNSFNEFSMRYARATDDFYVPAPEDVRTQTGKPGAYKFEPVSDELAETTREEMRAVYEQAYSTYERLVEQGVAREVARSVLPVGAYTEFYWTVNARSLMNFIRLRAHETAQREIRRYAEAVERLFAQEMPVTYDAFVKFQRDR